MLRRSQSPRAAFLGSSQILHPFDKGGCEWKENSCLSVLPSVPEPKMTNQISFSSLGHCGLVCESIKSHYRSLFIAVLDA